MESAKITTRIPTPLLVAARRRAESIGSPNLGAYIRGLIEADTGTPAVMGSRHEFNTATGRAANRRRLVARAAAKRKA